MFAAIEALMAQNMDYTINQQALQNTYAQTIGGMGALNQGWYETPAYSSYTTSGYVQVIGSSGDNSTMSAFGQAFAAIAPRSKLLLLCH